jgi:hypothetical protein
MPRSSECSLSFIYSNSVVYAFLISAMRTLCPYNTILVKVIIIIIIIIIIVFGEEYKL